MKSLQNLTDPVYNADYQPNAYDRLWLKLMNDKRDLPFIHLLTLIQLTVFPVAIILFTNLLTGWVWWAVAAVYFYVSQFYFKGRFGLMFHCFCHRKTFKPAYQSKFHFYITWILCPLFGHAPEGYFSHHMGMHHVENNNEEDTSSTMHYQRDSVVDFIKYFLNFIFLGVINTIQYLFNRKRKKLYTRLTLGEYVYMVFCIAMCFVNLKATMVVFIVPLLFARLVMMLGNWTQHSFIDAQDPDNLYTNSINCINTVYNHTCWNDGYHIIHHIRPGLHYTEMPAEFLKRKDEFANKKAIVFDGIHYLHIFIYLMTKQYHKLADNLVNINGMFDTREQAIAVMRERTRKCYRTN
ncbi:fatty acid desaturase family protein [Niabella sp. 22666]|uniref:fatty acid desaturase family protein n=1 Tax=Niabella sp. 22666 TaxID=3453954 RepID=UPI003F858F93